MIVYYCMVSFGSCGITRYFTRRRSGSKRSAGDERNNPQQKPGGILQLPMIHNYVSKNCWDGMQVSHGMRLGTDQVSPFTI